MAGFAIEKSGDGVETLGLQAHGIPEIRLDTRAFNERWEHEARLLLKDLGERLMQPGGKIDVKNLIPYGYWNVLLVKKGKRFHVYEPDSSGTRRQEGADTTLQYWTEQHDLCAQFGADYQPPGSNSYVVVSRDVQSSPVIGAVRYPSPTHMSGWWITGQAYNGDVSTLLREHFYHVTHLSPDIARLVALPYGYRFELIRGESVDVWYDEKAAED